MNTKMVVLIVGLLGLVIFQAAAIGIVDIGVRTPVLQTGAFLEDASFDNGGEPPRIFPVPFLTLGGRSDLGNLKLGYGARLFGVVVVNFAYPLVWIDAEPVDRFEVQAGLGGGAFGVFGFVPDFNFAFFSPTVIPELSGYYRLGNYFRIGGGAKGIVTFEQDRVSNYLLYVEVKARVPF